MDLFSIGASIWYLLDQASNLLYNGIIDPINNWLERHEQEKLLKHQLKRDRQISRRHSEILERHNQIRAKNGLSI